MRTTTGIDPVSSVAPVSAHEADDLVFPALALCVEIEGAPVEGGVVTFTLSERRALRMLARAGMLPTLARREAG